MPTGASFATRCSSELTLPQGQHPRQHHGLSGQRELLPDDLRRPQLGLDLVGRHARGSDHGRVYPPVRALAALESSADGLAAPTARSSWPTVSLRAPPATDGRPTGPSSRCEVDPAEDRRIPNQQGYGSNPLLMPAIYDPKQPAGSRWSRQGLQPAQFARLYHSTAMLLPDGSVVVAGCVAASSLIVADPLAARTRTVRRRDVVGHADAAQPTLSVSPRPASPSTPRTRTGRRA